MRKINVLSTFNGMGCIWHALKRARIHVNKRYSSEIDKYANQANDTAYPDTIQLSDVTKWREWDIDWSRIDLFVGGSPCQGFSFAGKQLNFNDPRSKLFFEFVAIWNHIKKHNPDAKFLLENVNMKKEYLRVISEYLGVFPVRINSNLVSAQNRDRWYWTNIKTKETGLFSELWADIPQPKDKGILLKDVLQPESEVDEKYYMSDKMMKYLNNRKANFNAGKINIRNEELKASCLLSSMSSIDISDNFIKIDKQGKIKPDQNKAGCLTAGGNSGGNHSDMDIICVSMVGRRIDESGIRKDNDKSIPAIQRLEPVQDENKTNCLTSVSKDKLILQKGRGFNKGGIHYDKAPTLTSNSWEHNNILQQNYKLRRLTPRECGRLQTFTEEELDVLLSSGISDTQLYKMFGNGWTVDVIAHILQFYKHV